MKFQIITIAATLGLLAGCAPTTQTAKPIDVRYTSNEARKVFGFHPMTVRTFQKQTDGPKAEVTNVPCTLKGSGFSASFTTPVVVNVPVYGLASRAIQTTCTFDGVEKSFTSKPVNLTESKAVSSGGAGGLLGALIVAAAVSARKDRNTDEYGYSPVSFTYDPK